MPTTYLDFEKFLADLDKRLETLGRSPTLSAEEQNEMSTLEEQRRRQETETYGALTPWQRVQLSRHQDRPYTLDYIEHLLNALK